MNGIMCNAPRPPPPPPLAFFMTGGASFTSVWES